MNSLKNVSVIGLTGQSGAGKTTVCNAFAKKGFAIINADKIARMVCVKGSSCLRSIADVFPECINDKTGELDRAKMANLVFNDVDFLKIYNSIIYPYITTRILTEIRNLSMIGSNLILLDAPTLFESRADDLCNYIVCIIADEEIRRKRISQRDSISDDAIMSRFSSQKDDEFYITRSDIVLKNNGSLEELERIAEEAACKIKEMFNA